MRRLCKYCGTEYEGDPGGSCCPDCAAAQRATTLRPRICRQCGVTFEGGPRAWYCPDCRRERTKEATLRYHRKGPARPIGSTDLCEVCGKPYTVNSARQRYCKDCAPEAIRAVDNAQSREWNRDNTTPEARRMERKTAAAAIQCVICGKDFVPNSAAVTCSPVCSAELKRRGAAAWEASHKAERSAYRRNLRQAKKAAQDPADPAPTPETRTCKVCGDAFAVTNKSQRKCPACREKHRRKPGAPLSDPIPCAVCGTPFLRASPNQRHCPDCREKRAPGGTPMSDPVPCNLCDRMFLRTAPTQKYCPACQETRRSRAIPMLAPVFCARCGRQFIRTAANQRYCPACRQETKKD